MIFQTMLEQWDVFLEVLNVFKLPYDVTNALQTQSFTLSDFYLCWLKIIHKLKGQIKKGTLSDLGELLLERLLIRKKALLNNAAMMTAVFLDPRVSVDLSSDEEFIAKKNIEKMYTKVKEIKAQDASNSGTNSVCPSVTANEGEAEDSFSRLMAEKAAARRKSVLPEATVSQEFDIFNSLNQFEIAAMGHQNKPVLAFWEELKDEFPELYEVASIIYSIPPTQAAVERSFSILNFIFTDRRSKLGRKMLQDILTIKLNTKIVREINSRDIKRVQCDYKVQF